MTQNIVRSYRLIWDNLHLQKKAHNPILFETKTFQQSWDIPWLGGIQLYFGRQNTT